jgi:hypothetical protein
MMCGAFAAMSLSPVEIIIQAMHPSKERKSILKNAYCITRNVNIEQKTD